MSSGWQLNVAVQLVTYYKGECTARCNCIGLNPQERTIKYVRGGGGGVEMNDHFE